LKKLAARIFSFIALILIATAIVVQLRFSANMNAQYELPPIPIAREITNANLELGKRIYHVRNGCVDCHGVDLSGTLIMDNGPMGTIFGVNITAHKLSTWSDEEVARAIRYGIHKTGRSLRFMPSFDFEGLSLGDTAALVAYLRSVPAVAKDDPENSFGPAARILSAFGQMPVMFPASIIDGKKAFAEKPAETPSLEFGKYLAHSCIGCHGAELKGGRIPGGDPSWPEATNLRLGGDSAWNEEKFRSMLRTGISPSTGQALRPPMPTALLQQLNEVESTALWKYLSSLK